MSEEEKRNVFKINVPIFTNEELEKLDYTIENYLDSIVNQISETVSRDRDIIILKKVIEKQGKEIEELKKYEEGYKLLTYSLNNYISKDKIKKYDEWIKEGGDYVESLEAQRYSLNELLEE